MYANEPNCEGERTQDDVIEMRRSDIVRADAYACVTIFWVQAVFSRAWNHGVLTPRCVMGNVRYRHILRLLEHVLIRLSVTLKITDAEAFAQLNA